MAWSRLLSVWTGGGHCVGGRQECASLALLQRCPSGIIAPRGLPGLVLLVVQLWCSGVLLRFAAEPVEVLLARHPFGVEQACSARFFAVSILVPCPLGGDCRRLLEHHVQSVSTACEGLRSANRPW